MDRTVPLNEAGVDAVLAAIESPGRRNLVRMAVAVARMKLIRWDGQSDDEWESGLPEMPFDMGFLARAVSDAFKDEAVVRGILDGASIEQATGWDV